MGRKKYKMYSLARERTRHNKCYSKPRAGRKAVIVTFRKGKRWPQGETPLSEASNTWGKKTPRDFLVDPKLAAELGGDFPVTLA